MKSLSTLFRAVDDMKELMDDPEWLRGFLYISCDAMDAPDINLGVLMQYFKFDKAYEQFSTYYEAHPDDKFGSPNHEDITRFFQHLREIGMLEKHEDTFTIDWTDEASGIYKQILDGTYPKTVDWDLELPWHPYQDLSGYRS